MPLNVPAFDALVAVAAKAKDRASELHVAHADGTVHVTQHASTADAKTALVAHLTANGGSGYAVITPKGNPAELTPRAVHIAHSGSGGQYATGWVADTSPLPTLKADAFATTEHQGMPIMLDRPKGFVQEGTDDQGAPWRRTYRYDYGFIPKTSGGDDEDTDVFLGPNPDAPDAFWAVQTKADGSFDEFKVFLGFSSLALARGCYKLHIPPRFCAGWFSVPVAAMKSMMGLQPAPLLQGLIKMRNRLAKDDGPSFDVLSSAVSAALNDAFPPATSDGSYSPSSVWLTELYDTSVVYTNDGVLYKDGFTFSNGKAILAGAPVAVMRTYVPAAGQSATSAGEVAMSEKNVKKDEGQGAGDILSLAAERLNVVAATAGKGDGTITPEVAAEIQAVQSLLQVAGDLYSGDAAPDSAADLETEDDVDAEGGGDAEGDGALEMADLADAEKNGGIVKMSSAQLIAYCAKKTVEARKETDPMQAAIKIARIETMAMSAMAVAKMGGDLDSIPVVIIPDANLPKVEPDVSLAGILATQQGNGLPVGHNANSTGATSPNLGGSGGTGANTGTEKLSKATAGITALRGKLAAVTGGKVGLAKNEPAPAVAPDLASAGPELFTPEYIDKLPDAAFLFVEEGVETATGQKTPKEARHFPYRDIAGKTVIKMLDKAISEIPTWPAQAAYKRNAMNRAESLRKFARDEVQSAKQAAARGDSGVFRADMSPPNPRAPQNNALQTYGHDNLPGKITAAVGTSGK